MIYKILFYISIGVISSLIGTTLWYRSLSQAYQDEHKQLQTKYINISNILELQNKSIEKNRIELEKYKSTRNIVSNSIKNKYDKVIIDKKTCETELNSMKELLNVFNNRKD